MKQQNFTMYPRFGLIPMKQESTIFLDKILLLVKVSLLLAFLVPV